MASWTQLGSSGLCQAGRKGPGPRATQLAPFQTRRDRRLQEKSRPPCDPACPLLPCPETAITIPGGLFSLHVSPWAASAEPASWAGGLRRDPGIRCCSAVPPPSQADVTAAAGEAFLLGRCWRARTGLWDLGSPAVRRTLFGLPPLLAGVVSWWFPELPGFGGLGC